MSTDSVTPNHTTTASSHEAAQASSPTPQVGESNRAHAADMRRRLIVSAPLGILATILSMVPAWQFTGWQWVVAAITIPVVTWGAWPFHRAAFAAGRHGSTTMDTLVSLGVIASTLWSWWALLWGGAGMLGMRMQMSLIPRAAHAGHAEVYFEVASTIVVFLLTGRYLEARARYRAGDALRSLLSMGAKEATLVRLDPDTGARTENVVPASSLQVGDLFAVRPGEKVATDGVIVEGSSALDTSLLTGESVPVDAAPGDAVTGATVNTWGSLLVRATRVGSDTTLAQMGRMVAEAQAGKAPVQRLADQISGVFVPIVIVVSLLTLGGWLLAGGGVQAAFTAAVAVLVVACPCALGLATPTAILVGSGRASQLGILIKNAEILEQTRSIDTMLLDKTGTVTTGVMSLESVAVPTAGRSPEVDEASALSLAASVESLSEHPVARAITSGASDRGLSLEPVTAFANQPGLGVVGITAQGGVLVGRPSWLASLGVDVPASLVDAVREAETSGASAVVAALAPNLASAASSSPEPAAATPEAPASVTLPGPDAKLPLATLTMSVVGMTCASCVGRVERKLGKLDGVSAEVNLATESARITLTAPHSDEELEAAVNAAGYHGTVTSRSEAASSDGAPATGGSATGDTGTPTQPGTTPGAGEREGAPASSLVIPERVEGRAIAALVVRDTVKESSADAIAQLRELGIEPILLTGDNEAAAQHVADQVGIDRVIAGVLPDGKRDTVANLQAEGRTVAMVGDGVNDAAALAQASAKGLGIAMGSGTDVAIEVADMTLMNSSLTSAATAIRVSRRTLRIIKENLFWAFFYNILMVPLAIAGLLSPMLASAAMACSSVFVVLNSLRLRTAK
ncbi:heavy metal translocating P-type ATPase [Schaalia odontolytica]|uniref:Copper-exporting P-type ATPase A n=1 Tax=Schaalia odontolytica TaxID=1660 RepID=A0A2X0U4Y3_9ACTO|nr:heavy metal translocating P-type ATPase [Schaalia odontolytica]WMS26552.1 heavy metal translocating P-type ATPase [Schaalia odontolytica]SPT55335.1 Copper-exporting P-type ATPase A [Schaalia odontolytica]